MYVKHTTAALLFLSILTMFIVGTAQDIFYLALTYALVISFAFFPTLVCAGFAHLVCNVMRFGPQDGWGRTRVDARNGYQRLRRWAVSTKDAISHW